jgi:hypothetical protein
MLSASECLLKAENYTFAATMSSEGQERMVLLGAAAYWRNKAFDLQMERFRHLREVAEGEMPPGKDTAH